MTTTNWSWDTNPTPDPVPAPTGWFAILHAGAFETVDITEGADSVGVIQANETVPVTDSADVVGTGIGANETVPITNDAVAVGKQNADNSFATTNDAAVKGVQNADNSFTVVTDGQTVGKANADNTFTIINDGIVTNVIAPVNADQIVPIVNDAIVIGKQNADETFSLTNDGVVVGKVSADNTVPVMFSDATLIGAPYADTSFVIATDADVWGIVNADNTIPISSSADVTGALDKMNVSEDFNYSAQLAVQKPTFWRVGAGTPTANGTQFAAPSSRVDAILTNFEMATDSFRIDCVMGTRNIGKSAIIIGADATFTKVAYLEVETGSITNNFHIVFNTRGVSNASNFSYNSTGYARKVTTGKSVVAAHTVSVSYTDSDSTYRTYYDGALVNSFADTTHIFPHGAGWRYGGLIVDMEATTNHGVNWDSFNMYDL